MRLPQLLAVSALTAVLLTGCSGKTLAPNAVTETTATLRGQGTCDGTKPSTSPCYYWFKVREAGNPSTEFHTAKTGPIKGKVVNVVFTGAATGLRDGTKYEYQVCGYGDGVAAKDYACAGPSGKIAGTDWQSFTTRSYPVSSGGISFDRLDAESTTGMVSDGSLTFDAGWRNVVVEARAVRTDTNRSAAHTCRFDSVLRRTQVDCRATLDVPGASSGQAIPFRAELRACAVNPAGARHCVTRRTSATWRFVDANVPLMSTRSDVNVEEPVRVLDGDGTARNARIVVHARGNLHHWRAGKTFYYYGGAYERRADGFTYPIEVQSVSIELRGVFGGVHRTVASIPSEWDEVPASVLAGASRFYVRTTARIMTATGVRTIASETPLAQNS